MGEAALKKTIGPQPIVITAPGVNKAALDLESAEKRREAANQDKVVTDPNLKILADILLEKEKVWQLSSSYKDIPIQGQALATKDQARALLKPITATCLCLQRRQKWWNCIMKKQLVKILSGTSPFARLF